MADFLNACARRLEAGEDAERVMVDLRARYTTLRCVNVKACLVRAMCAASREHTDACVELMARREELREWFDASVGTFRGGIERAVWTQLPPRHCENVRKFTITRAELRTCKRASATQTILKNKFSERVHGRALVRHARAVVLDDGNTVNVAELALALMLVTGRRECEILNGRSVFTPHTEYSVLFAGQAKKRGPHAEYVIPVLVRAPDVVRAVERLRSKQGGVMLSNRDTSRRYQSYLGRHVATRHPWTQCTRVHSLRGVYTCMAARLFHWDHADAFVAMCILGHTGLMESLVYTPFHLGDDFADEPRLGVGHLTIWEEESSSTSTPSTSSP